MKTILVFIATNLVCACFHLKSTGSHYLCTLNYYQILFTILKIYSLLQFKILKTPEYSEAIIFKVKGSKIRFVIPKYLITFHIKIKRFNSSF